MTRVEIEIEGPTYKEVAAVSGCETYDASLIKKNVIEAVGFAVNDVILTNIAFQAVNVYEEIVAKLCEKGVDVENVYRYVALLAVIILLVEWALAVKSFLCEDVHHFIVSLPCKIESIFQKCKSHCSDVQCNPV